MKRSPMPARKKPMKRGAKSIKQGAPIKRGKGISPKPSKKKLEFDAELNAVTPMLVARSGGLCEIQVPKVCEGQATNRHHRKDRSLGGRNELTNLLHLCGSGTTGCHGYITRNPLIANHNGWSVQSWQKPEEVPVISFRPEHRDAQKVYPWRL